MEALCPTEFYCHAADCWSINEERILVSEEYQDFFLTKILQPLSPYSMEQSSDFWGAAIVTLLPAYFSGMLKEDKDKGVFDLKFSGEEMKSGVEAQSQKVISALIASLDSYEGFLFIFFGAHFEIPQGLFVAVIRYWKESGLCLKESKVASHLMEILANYPIGNAPGTWDDVAVGSHSKEWLKHIQRVFREPRFVPFLPCGLSENEWFLNMFDSFIPMEYEGAARGETLHAWSKKISMLRNPDLRGRYPWKPESFGCNWYSESDGTEPGWDTHVHIGALLRDHTERGIIGAEEYYEYYCWKTLSLHQNFWIAADREGFAEFGNAMFALYLMRLGYFDLSQNQSHSHVDWPVLTELVHSALDRPGHRWVRTALEFLQSIWAEKKWDLDRLRLRNIAPSSAQVIAFPSGLEVAEKIDKPRREIEKKIVAELGVELWDRFSSRSKNLMIDAERTFSRIAPDLGTGQSEFGGTVVDYARAFECELIIRLEDVYKSPSMRQYCEQNSYRTHNRPPTLGDCIWMLEQAGQVRGKASMMPNELISAIEGNGISAHKNSKLLEQLRKLKGRRDPGAHGSEKILPGKLVDLRHIVFLDGLLKEFLESLSSNQPN
jgi:hypothetical protein